jgi:hypothetical protein
LPSSVEALFRSAGWREVQRAEASGSKVSSAAESAAELIAEFGGLHVGATGSGQDIAASDVFFYERPRPDVSVVVNAWHSHLGELAAFANAHADHIIVFVDSGGDFYAFTDPDEKLYFIGSSFGEAMERLLLGMRYGSAIGPSA